jgi:branched-chain amino acid transport system ATP-binding protein
VSGAITGLGGALFALQQTSVSDTQPFILRESLLLVAIVVVGGARSPIGILLAAFATKAVPDLLAPQFGQGVQLLIPVILAGVLVLSVVLQPEGVGGVLRDLRDVLGGASERPMPRPVATDPVVAAARARSLREVPRPLTQRLPVPALLVARKVSVRYDGVIALADVDLQVRRSEIVGLIGANGAGKSTFFNAVSGLAPATGSIRYRDRELLTSPAAGRSARGIARTFQDMGLVRAETVRENVLLAQGWMARYPAATGMLALGVAVPTERELRRRADQALELFGLHHLAQERLGDLPYGTMRIVEIAAAVASGPDLLLLDEASAGLTPWEAHDLGDRFRALRDELGLTLVVIEHHVPLIAETCDYCYCLESGVIIAEGTPAEVTAQPRVVESFLGRGTLQPVGVPG